MPLYIINNDDILCSTLKPSKLYPGGSPAVSICWHNFCSKSFRYDQLRQIAPEGYFRRSQHEAIFSLLFILQTLIYLSQQWFHLKYDFNWLMFSALFSLQQFSQIFTKTKRKWASYHLFNFLPQNWAWYVCSVDLIFLTTYCSKFKTILINIFTLNYRSQIYIFYHTSISLAGLWLQNRELRLECTGLDWLPTTLMDADTDKPHEGLRVEGVYSWRGRGRGESVGGDHIWLYGCIVPPNYSTLQPLTWSYSYSQVLCSVQPLLTSVTLITRSDFTTPTPIPTT